MPSIPISGADFVHPFLHLNGRRQLRISWSQLIWAAITVGKADASYLLRYGVHSGFELIYRAAMVWANLRDDSIKRLEKTEAFDALDPSEKGAMSYFFGLMSAKLVGELLFDVPWLMHLDVYRKQLHPVILHRGKVKPDLIGRNANGDWVVIEAKGRSHALPAGTLVQAKRQTQNLKSVNGKAMALRVALGAHFEGQQLAIAISDPEEGHDAARLDLSPEHFEMEYYRPIQSLINETGRAQRYYPTSQGLFRVAQVPELDLAVGLREPERASKLGSVIDEPTIHSGATPVSEYIGQDGVWVRLGPSWSEDRMTQEPSDRPIIPIRDRVT